MNEAVNCQLSTANCQLVNQMDKRWKIKDADEHKVQALADALKVHPLISRILVGRGIENFEEAKTYFRPDTSQLHDPMADERYGSGS